MVVGGPESGVMNGRQSVGEAPNEVGRQVDMAERDTTGGDLGKPEAMKPGAVGSDEAVAVRGDEDTDPAVRQEERGRLRLGGQNLAGVEVDEDAVRRGGDGSSEQPGGLKVAGQRGPVRTSLDQPMERRVQNLGHQGRRPRASTQPARPRRGSRERRPQQRKVFGFQEAFGPKPQVRIRREFLKEGT